MLPAHALSPAALAPLLERARAAPYRAAQVLDWVYRRGVADPVAMTQLPRELRAALAGEIAAPGSSVMLARSAADGTRKLVVRLEDGERVECVLIPDRHRLTLCVSCQVGCAMGCGFCATGRLGLRRQLRVEEIVDQVMLARAELARDPLGPGHLSNVVFMGMGEPLHNLDALLAALEILTAPWGLAISPRRITVSTVGLVPEMVRLLERSAVNLAVSLHATTDEARRRLVPVTRKYGLGALLDACRALPLPRRRRITFEYVLLAGENDSDEDARRLVGLLHGIRSKVNLIRFNPFPGAEYAPSAPERVERFQRLLLDRGQNATVRESRGAEVAAACGQLAAWAGEPAAPAQAHGSGASRLDAEPERQPAVPVAGPWQASPSS